MANKCLLENDPFLHLQHFLVGKVSFSTAQRAIKSLEKTQRIIVESCRGKIAKAWLSAIPTTKSLRVPDDLMRIALKLFLNVPLMPKFQKCPACGKAYENFNAHPHLCK